MGGLAAGIYGQLNGYDTSIFEQHYSPGGQCASWRRKGYTFDGCIHHLFGCAEGSHVYEFWKEIGAMPRELAPTGECVSVAAPDGTMFYDYWDLERLEEHMKELAPNDAAAIEEYVRAIPSFARTDFTGEAVLGSRLRLATMAPRMIPMLKWLKPTMEEYAAKFRDPFMRRAFPLLEYSIPYSPYFLHLVKHAYAINKDIAWPVGASHEFAGSIAKKYRDYGGSIHYRQRVARILTEGGRAVGIRLEDGTEERADVVVSNADGRKTIMGLLDGQYTDARIREWCAEPDDETNWAVHVFLGVDRDLSSEPSAMVQLLDQPVRVAGQTADSIEMQMFGFDPTMAPEGKGTIKVELFSKYSYWKELYQDRPRYDEEKEKVASTVIEILERTHFPGITAQVEVVDVPTLMTWERYVGGTHGFISGPKKDFRAGDLLLGHLNSTLPGLERFHLVGTWATAAGALFLNAKSGRTVVRDICRRDGRKFTTR